MPLCESTASAGEAKGCLGVALHASCSCPWNLAVGGQLIGINCNY